jgi:hypothetical protein
MTIMKTTLISTLGLVEISLGSLVYELVNVNG